MYFLIDLERSIGGSRTTYWRANGRSYTTNIREAGVYAEPIAKQQVENDFDKRTVMVHVDTVKKILGESFFQEKPKYSLEELLEKITPENRHEEIDWGKPEGKEEW